MKSFRIKFFIGAFTVLLLLGLGYYYRAEVGRALRGLLNQLQPCQRPITYSIANFDSRFGLTEEELLNDVNRAEKIWESAVNKQLFEYSPAGDLKISFIYDYRQEATDALRKMGIVINDDRATYDTVKAKYDLLVVSYDKGKAQIEDLIANYNTDRSVYEKDVRYWNNHGKASRAEYDALEQKRIDLNNQVAIINQAKASFNGLVDAINSMEIVLNKLVVALNLQVGRYNTVSSSTGQQFNEGEYVKETSGTSINIFQFNDKNQLIRVLTHEFGHALGIRHLDNPKAIMYYLNEEGMNEKLTADDIAALKKACKIK